MSELNLDKSKVLTAVKGLKKVADQVKKTDILEDDVDLIQLQICVKKIPPKEHTVKLKMPHSIRQPNMEVCLFVKDLDRFDRDYEPTVNHFKDLLRKKGINIITEVVPLKSLKTEYKPYEAKRNLSNAYAIFLADARIVRLLPTYLGKHFYGKKKTPVQVNLESKDLAKEIDAAIDNSKCVIGSKGSSSLALVGHSKMDHTDVVDNIIAAANQISTSVAGGATNIKQLNIKTCYSLSIPIYMAKGGPQDVTIPRKERPGKNEAEEISTLLDGKVKVYPDGSIKIIKNGKEVTEAPKKRNSVKRPKQQGKALKKQGKRPKQQGKTKTDIKQPAAKKFKKTN